MCNKVQTTGYTEEQEDQIQFLPENINKRLNSSENDCLDQWNQDEAAPEWWEVKIMKKKKKQLMIQSIPHHLSNMVEAVLWLGSASGSRLLVFINDF